MLGVNTLIQIDDFYKEWMFSVPFIKVCKISNSERPPHLIVSTKMNKNFEFKKNIYFSDDQQL